MSYDAENRLVSVSGAVTATFVYDGDGNRVKGTIGGTTTAYIGNYFEWTGSTSTMKKYYYAGATRMAMRTGSSTLNYLLGDHLGSQAITTDSNGVSTAELRYYPWGTERYAAGSTPTAYHFTGQRWESALGLYFYNARWYDPYLNRWIQPDDIIPNPGNPQDLDRYAYVRNNPTRYIDPTGHYSEEEIFSIFGLDNWDDIYKLFEEGGQYAGMWGILDILRMAKNGDKLLDSFNQFEWNVIGEFNFIDGSLYLKKDGKLSLALPMIASGKYDHTALEHYLPFLGVSSYTATYIYLDSTLYTKRVEFDSSKIDWTGVSLDSSGIIADALSLGLAGRYTNAAKIANTTGKILGPIDIGYSAIQTAQEPSISSGAGLTSDIFGLFFPIIPDIFGLIFDFSPGIQIYP